MIHNHLYIWDNTKRHTCLHRHDTGHWVAFQFHVLKNVSSTYQLHPMLLELINWHNRVLLKRYLGREKISLVALKTVPNESTKCIIDSYAFHSPWVIFYQLWSMKDVLSRNTLTLAIITHNFMYSFTLLRRPSESYTFENKRLIQYSQRRFCCEKSSFFLTVKYV